MRAEPTSSTEGFLGGAKAGTLGGGAAALGSSGGAGGGLGGASMRLGAAGGGGLRLNACPQLPQNLNPAGLAKLQRGQWAPPSAAVAGGDVGGGRVEKAAVPALDGAAPTGGGGGGGADAAPSGRAGGGGRSLCAFTAGLTAVPDEDGGGRPAKTVGATEGEDESAGNVDDVAPGSVGAKVADRRGGEGRSGGLVGPVFGGAGTGRGAGGVMTVRSTDSGPSPRVTVSLSPLGAAESRSGRCDQRAIVGGSSSSSSTRRVGPGVVVSRDGRELPRGAAEAGPAVASSSGGGSSCSAIQGGPSAAPAPESLVPHARQNL